MLDEADRMLDKGFENDIRKIISFTMQGADRQTMMCTSLATLLASYPNILRLLQSVQRGQKQCGGSRARFSGSLCASQ